MNSGSAAELVRQAAEAVQNESFDAAVSFAQQALEIEPDSADAISVLGIAFSRLGRQEEAEAALQKAAALRPDAAAHYNLAAHFYASGNLEYAADHARATLSYDSGHEAAAALLRSIDWESQPSPYALEGLGAVEPPKPFGFVTDLGWSWTLLGCFLVAVYVVTRTILFVRFYESMPDNASSLPESEQLTWFIEALTNSGSLIIGAFVWLALMSAWWVVDNAHWRKSTVATLMVIGLVDAVILMCCTYGLGLVVAFTMYLVLTRRPPAPA